ncbi:MAG: rhodanese-like domain-containing protein [Sulfurovum sp.]
MKSILLILISISYLSAGQYDKVKITPDMSYIYVYHKGKAVKIHRNQNTKHKLTGEYVKIYRPNKDIQPIKINSKVKTVGEVELLHFMKDRGNTGKGLVIDLRTKKKYKKESIPSAINIPFRVKNNPEKISKVMQIFGARIVNDGSWDTSHAMDILFYCNGSWCDKSPRFIKMFLELGYPAEKMLYYRGGFQMWKILGFTTVKNK